MTARIREVARASGLAAMGCAPARPLEEGKALRSWLANGYQAGMRWMENPRIREDPSCFAPNARSVLVFGLRRGRVSGDPGPDIGRVANFAVGEDYHRVLKRKIKEVAKFLAKFATGTVRIAVDSAPLLERALANRAGLGWIGRNCCLISPRYGSRLLLGELLIPQELEYGPLHPNRCGDCRRCQEACPTGALVAPGVVDSNRCVAYWTVEAKGAIPRTLRPQMGAWIFGCDACQEACPWNRFAERNTDEVREPMAAFSAATFLEETDDSFRRRYQKTAFMRAGRSGMARNAAVVLGNSGFAGGLRALRRATEDSAPLVRGHAAWALGRRRDFQTLRNALAREKDKSVREEIEAALVEARG